MKTRVGFVSNSSSSSFIVKYRTANWSAPVEGRPKGFVFPKTVFHLSTAQLKSAKKYGFKYTRNPDPSSVGLGGVEVYGNFKDVPHDKLADIYLCRSVTCNQDDVMDFLFRHKIAFCGICHYDQEIVSWNGRDEFFYQAPNVLQSCIRGAELQDVKFAVQKRNIKDFCNQWTDILKCVKGMD